ncbi:MAG: hypothetical protein P8Z71_09680 [Candidatus Sulfobium sp.]
MLRSFRLASIVAVSLITLLTFGLASADSFRGGVHRGGDYRGGGHEGGYYRGGEHHGGYYRDRDRHGHYRGDFNVVIGGSWGWGPWWGYASPYYYPYYTYYPYYSYPYSYGFSPYYYAPSVVPETPQSYIEREGPEPSPTASNWPQDWFYCPDSKAYYPYVKECKDGWQTVPSTPPSESGQVKPSKSSAPSGVWFYCRDSKAYYPYVKKCPGGWQTVPAKPAAGPEER